MNLQNHYRYENFLCEEADYHVPKDVYGYNKGLYLIRSYVALDFNFE